jgi:hypothetical protein
MPVILSINISKKQIKHGKFNYNTQDMKHNVWNTKNAVLAVVGDSL